MVVLEKIKSLAPTGMETPDRPVRSLVAIPTWPPRLSALYASYNNITMYTFKSQETRKNSLCKEEDR